VNIGSCTLDRNHCMWALHTPVLPAAVDCWAAATTTASVTLRQCTWLPYILILSVTGKVLPPSALMLYSAALMLPQLVKHNSSWCFGRCCCCCAPIRESCLKALQAGTQEQPGGHLGLLPIPKCGSHLPRALLWWANRALRCGAGSIADTATLGPLPRYSSRSDY
jgi:hypothetical protein